MLRIDHDLVNAEHSKSLGRGYMKSAAAFLTVVIASMVGTVLGITFMRFSGQYMPSLTGIDLGADYKAKALAYGKAIDEGAGWNGMIRSLTESEDTPWEGQVCMINAWNITTIKAYAEWVAESLEQFPRMMSIDWIVAWDPDSYNAMVYAVWTGANTAGPGATMRFATGSFVYKLHFNFNGKIDKFTKVWNDEWSARQLGWPAQCECPAPSADFPCFSVPLGPKEVL